jgi:hypothetical protein
MITRIEITPALRAAIEAVRKADEAYAPGAESSAVIELPKLALADTFLDALRDQTRARLPRRADRGVLFVRLQPAVRRGRG